MGKIAKKKWVLAGFVFVFVLFSVVCFIPRQSTAAEGEERGMAELEGREVVVEALIVEVRISALYDSDTSPVDRRLDAISINNIREYSKDKANSKVLAGASLALAGGGPGSVRDSDLEQELIDLRLESGEVAREHEWFDYGFEFDAEVLARSGRRLELEYSVEHKSKTGSEPLGAHEMRWHGVVRLEENKPHIAGAVQDEEMAVFLILSADVDGK